jgi:UMP-CMP kinase
LGGPGSGKGVCCEKLSKEYQFKHYSVGQLLRNEATIGSEEGKLISKHIEEGKIVPRDIVIRILKKEILKNERGSNILVDGFPRELGQVIQFEKEVFPCKFLLFLECSEEEMEKRILGRSKTSGRSDDNPDCMKKRFETFKRQTLPVIDYYKVFDKVKTIDANRTFEEVFTDVLEVFNLKEQSKEVKKEEPNEEPKEEQPNEEPKEQIKEEEPKEEEPKEETKEEEPKEEEPKEEIKEEPKEEIKEEEPKEEIKEEPKEEIKEEEPKEEIKEEEPKEEIKEKEETKEEKEPEITEPNEELKKEIEEEMLLREED